MILSPISRTGMERTPLRYLDLSGDWQSKLAKDLLHEAWGLAGPPQYGRAVDQAV